MLCVSSAACVRVGVVSAAFGLGVVWPSPTMTYSDPRLGLATTFGLARSSAADTLLERY